MLDVIVQLSQVHQANRDTPYYCALIGWGNLITPTEKRTINKKTK